MRRAVVGMQRPYHVYRAEWISPLAAPSFSMTDTDWDTWDARLFRYHLYDLYTTNQVFTDLEKFRLAHLKRLGLYKFTRSIYNPVARLINITAAKCYGGNLDWDTLESGAIPLQNLDEKLRTAIRTIWRWSNWGELKMPAVRQLARYGDSILKIVDDPEKERVRLEVLHPGVIRDAVVDAVGYVKEVTIEYLKPDPENDSRLVTYREVITKDAFRTYRVVGNKEELYGWHTAPDGTPMPEWENIYGFVPLVIARANSINRSWGTTTYFNTLDKIDELNSQASLIHDQIRKLVDALIYFPGVGKMSEVSAPTVEDNDDPLSNYFERETLRVLKGPPGSRADVVAANVDFSGAIKTLENLMAEIEHDLPELSFAKLRDYQLHSSPAVRTALGDAEDRLLEFNGNADMALLRALQMGITMGGIQNYDGFESFGPDDYDRGNLDFQIVPRDIIADTLSKNERLNLLLQSDAPTRWVWRELDVEEDEIVRAEADQLTQERVIAADVARTLATGIADEEAEQEQGADRAEA